MDAFIVWLAPILIEPYCLHIGFLCAWRRFLLRRNMEVIRASAPGSCALVGAPTDLCGGSVLACTTRDRATCSIYYDSDEPGISIHVLGQNYIARTLDDLVLQGDLVDAARAALSLLEVDPAHVDPFRIVAVSDLPFQQRFLASSAVLSAICGALFSWSGIYLNLYEMAEFVAKVQHLFWGASSGFQGPSMSVFGGFSYLDFRDKPSAEYFDPNFPFTTVEPLQQHLKSCCGITAAVIEGEPSASDIFAWRKGLFIRRDPADHALCDSIRQLAAEAKKALLGHDWMSLGEIMDRNRKLLDSQFGDRPQENKLAAAALEAGAFGAMYINVPYFGGIVTIAQDRVAVEEALKEAGADFVVNLEPTTGLTVEMLV